MVALDKLELYGLREDPDLWEELIVREQVRAERDPLAAAILESTYWERDREGAFNRFLSSLDFQEIDDLLTRFRIDRNAPLVEIGGGSGFLSWALTKRGFTDVSLLEPNARHITGTGYLQSRPDAAGITVENSLDRWYQSARFYKTIITRNCIHHFPNTAYVAAAIRQKLEPGGRWVVIREPYADNAHELYRFFHTHPYSQRYGVFEFAFPASHFVSSLELAGFRLKAVVPSGYANNALSLYENKPGSFATRLSTRTHRWFLKHWPAWSVFCYRLEQSLKRLLPIPGGWFSRPQVMLFERRELGELSPEAIWYPMER